jgi:hypothetical protein
MTTAELEPKPEGFKVPNVLKLDFGTILIPDDLTQVDNLKALRTIFAEANHLLSLLNDEDFVDSEYNQGQGWVISTDNQAALRYAALHYFTDDHSCVVDAVFNYIGEDVCSSCIDDLIEEQLEKDFSVEALNDGVYVVFKGEAE